MSDFDRRIAPTFAAQLSLATRLQVLAAGATNSLIARRLRSGAWAVAEPGVYALAGVEWTWRRNLAAVVLSVSGAVASHRAASVLLGVVADDRAVRPIELAVPVGRTPRRDFALTRERVGDLPIIVHESIDLHRDAPVLVDGVPTTPPLRLAVDLGSVVPFDPFRRAVGQIRRLHGVDWVSLERSYRRHAAQGRNGCGALRDLLDRHFGEQGAPDEVVEIRCADLIRRAGLPTPVHQFSIQRADGKVARFDLAYPELRIGIETEGSIHGEDEVRRSDNRRRNSVQLKGWKVFTFSWEEVTFEPAYVVETIRQALVEAGALV
jgi:hypothetical protein